MQRQVLLGFHQLSYPDKMQLQSTILCPPPPTPDSMFPETVDFPYVSWSICLDSADVGAMFTMDDDLTPRRNFRTSACRQGDPGHVPRRGRLLECMCQGDGSHCCCNEAIS